MALAVVSDEQVHCHSKAPTVTDADGEEEERAAGSSSHATAPSLTLIQFRMNRQADELLHSRLQVAYSYRPSTGDLDSDPLRTLSLLFDGVDLRQANTRCA
jgi:hypothetical protein